MGSSYPKPAFESHIHDNKVKRGEDIVLRCEANTDEVQVMWEKNGRRLYEGDRISICKQGKDLKLTITQAKEEDEGKYTVKLKNDQGSASETVTVSIRQYDRDWRSINWGRNQSIKQSLQEYQLSGQGPKQLRILLHGPLGAGKSSLINSINSIFQGQVKVGALASAHESKSFTKVHETFFIRDKHTGLLPFVFSDVMGFEAEDSQGVHTDDIISILGGHIKDTYEFKPESPLTEKDPDYNRSPTLNDKIHCLVSVLPADKITLMADSLMEKMRDVRQHASAMGIPQVVFMTRIDLMCSLVKDNVRDTYSSKIIKRKMETCSNKLGVPMNCIFPVKNYHEEIHLNANMDSLILHALKSTVGLADDYVNRLHYEGIWAKLQFSLFLLGMLGISIGVQNVAPGADGPSPIHRQTAITQPLAGYRSPPLLSLPRCSGHLHSPITHLKPVARRVQDFSLQTFGPINLCAGAS